MRHLDLTSYLRGRGISIETLSRHPDAVAELARVTFLEQNYFSARTELRNYIVLVAVAPLSAPMLYFLKPSPVMLGCSIGFATIVVGTCVTQILRRKRTMRDYLRGVERLVLMAKKSTSH
jgi:hypothetical protein